MDVSHNFRFRWNDHVPHLSQIFSELRFDEVYCDTTLISDDGFVLKAHGAVLSATSRYFERVLSDVTPDQHPIIVLKGAHFTELTCLLDYIYEGVTQVDQHLMESVLDVADMLEIKGLSKMKNNLSIKKLIAPSPPSSVVSRSSPQCSSPSKSPTPPSHTPHNHSPSCPSSPTESYGSSVGMLKIDTDDSNELSEPTQKKMLAFHEGKVSMSTNPIENKEYAASVPSNPQGHAAICQGSDYSDQTLGIDLSVSRPTNEESERTSIKNFNLQEDTPLRKRKIMKYEEFSPSSNDLEWGKVGEKVKDSMPHKKKKIFTKSVTQTKSSSRSSSREETHKTTTHFTLEKLASMLAKDRNEGKSVNDASPLSALVPKHKPKSPSAAVTPPERSESEDSLEPLDSQVEVLCSDGALTISVTTESAHQSTLKNLNNFNGAHVSLSLKKAKKRYRYRRQVEAVKKENIEEKRSYPQTLLKRPNTRFFKRLKSHGAQNQPPPRRSESLSVHCDPPFPTEDGVQQKSAIRKEKSPTSLILHVEEDKSEKEICAREDSAGDGFANQSRPLGKDCEEKSSRGFNCISPLTLFTLPPVKEREKQTRTSLTLEEKIKVIEAFLDGKSQRQIAHLYGIGKTQVNGIVKKREEILSLYRESLMRGEKLTMKRQRKSEYASLNEHLIKWYRHMTVVAGMKITTGMLRAKALQIAPQLGYHDFKASNGWLATFKANHNLKFSRAKKPSESYSNDNYDETEAQKEGEFFEDEVEEGTDMTTATVTQASSGSSSNGASGEAVNVHSVGLHLGSMRGDPDSEVASSGQHPPVGNLALGNSLLSGSAPLPKPPQMSNMALGTNIAYNLAREHPRSDLTHLSELHSAPTVNAPPSLAHPPHPTLAKPPEGPLSYKTEDSISYGYDTQGRMNEGAARGTEYNYTHYGFPSTYYGYHFLGQY